MLLLRSAASPSPILESTGEVDPPPPPRRGRDRYLDTLRAAAIVRVVFYHALGYTSTVLSAAFSFMFPSMGVMFALGGSLMAASLDRAAPGRTVLRRLRRLLPALWLLGAVLVPVMIAHGWRADHVHPLHWTWLGYWILPIANPPGSAWGLQMTGVLWYLRAYLWFVVFSPALLMIFRRWPVPTILAPLILLAAVSTGTLAATGTTNDAVTDFGTFGACWILGFAHRDGMLRRVRLRLLLGLAIPVAAAGAYWAAYHPESGSYDLNDIPLGQALYSLGVVLIILRFAPRMAWLRRVRWLDWLVSTINARAITIYLWHPVALVLNGPVSEYLGVYNLAVDVVVSWVLIAVAVVLFGWVEDLAARRPVHLIPGVTLLRRRYAGTASQLSARAEPLTVPAASRSVARAYGRRSRHRPPVR